MIKGTVIFKLTNKGTKSESEQPFLRVQEGVEFRIMAKGDNPFMHDILRPYENRDVEIDGRFNERRIFIATDIKELDDEPVEEPTVEAAAEPRSEEAPEATAAPEKAADSEEARAEEVKSEEIPEKVAENPEEAGEPESPEASDDTHKSDEE